MRVETEIAIADAAILRGRDSFRLTAIRDAVGLPRLRNRKWRNSLDSLGGVAVATTPYRC
jgi:hypothetical protein